MNAAQVIANDQSVQAPVHLTTEIVKAVLAELQHAYEASVYDNEDVMDVVAREGRDLVAGHMAARALERGYSRWLIWDTLLAATIAATRRHPSVYVQIVRAQFEGMIDYIRHSKDFAALDQAGADTVHGAVEAFSEVPGGKLTVVDELEIAAWQKVARAAFMLRMQEISGEGWCEGERDVVRARLLVTATCHGVRAVTVALCAIGTDHADNLIEELRSAVEIARAA